MFDGGDADDLLVVKNSTVASFASVTFIGGDGEQTLTAAGGALTLGDDISAAAGDVTLNLTNAAIVTLGATQRLAAVTITGGARLDVRDHRLILTNSATGVAIGGVYDGVHGLVQAGYMYGDWGGSGIVTTMPDAADDRGLTTLAVATAAHILFIAEHETALWGGQAVSGSDTIVMYTYAGDLNFDGVIDAADYGMIDNWVQFPGTDGYANGDFNFDGVIDAADYGIIDNSVQLQGPPLT
jgi:hypothetical protein